MDLSQDRGSFFSLISSQIFLLHDEDGVLYLVVQKRLEQKEVPNQDELEINYNSNNQD